MLFQKIKIFLCTACIYCIQCIQTAGFAVKNKKGSPSNDKRSCGDRTPDARRDRETRRPYARADHAIANRPLLDPGFFKKTRRRSAKIFGKKNAVAQKLIEPAAAPIIQKAGIRLLRPLPRPFYPSHRRPSAPFSPCASANRESFDGDWSARAWAA